MSKAAESMDYTLYLSGPMTGLADENRPCFHAWAGMLRMAGYRVVNPADLPRGWTWERYMKRGLEDLEKCDGIALLPGFLGSKGACKELEKALRRGMPYGTVRNWLAHRVRMEKGKGAMHEAA